MFRFMEQRLHAVIAAITTGRRRAYSQFFSKNLRVSPNCFTPTGREPSALLVTIDDQSFVFGIVFFMYLNTFNLNIRIRAAPGIDGVGDCRYFV